MMKFRVSLAILLTMMAWAATAAASSSLPAVLEGEDYAWQNADNPQFQKDVVGELADGAGLDAGAVTDIVVDHTGGTLVKSMTAAGKAAKTGNAEAARVVGIYKGIMNGKGADGRILTARQSQGILRHLAGETAFGPGTEVGSMTTDGISQAIGDRSSVILAERRALVDKFGSDTAMASAHMNMEFIRRVWFSAFYLHQNMGDRDGYAGYKYNAGGGTIGYDHAFGPFTAGAAATISRGSFKQKGFTDDNAVDNYGVSGYVNYFNSNGFFANLRAGYNYGDNDLKTHLPGSGWVSASNHTDSVWAGANVGYDFKPSSALVLTPTLGIFYSHSKSSEYTSRLQGVGLMEYGAISNHGWVLPAEVQARYTVDLDPRSSVTFSLSGGYRYNLTNKGARGRFNYAGVHDASTLINGLKPGRHGWNAGVGVKYRRDKFDCSIEYRYEGKAKYNGHKVMGSVGINF